MNKNKAMYNAMVSVVIGLCCVVLLPACNNASHKISASLTEQIRAGMSEKDVVDLLGPAERVSSTHVRSGDEFITKMMYYRLTDGRRWIIMLNAHDQLVGSGEQDMGRMQRFKGAFN